MMRSIPTLTALLVLGVAACDKPGADAQKKYDNAQAVASTEITNAVIKADEKTAEARAEEQKKIAAAQRDFEKAREDYRHEMQTKCDDLDKKLDDLDAKTNTATGKRKADLLAKYATLRQERDAFVTDFESLETTAAADWDAAKARVDKEWSRLKADADKAM